ncbi:MAG: Lrp/AsnC ligand binding domain-containing protein [Candidatus Hadarchaeota archaeon]|nr:Lrp/AsnC ligand binding domain-containing protein [Candidatus Hadarchaeota archaeon]
MVEAYILITAAIGKVKKAAKDLKKLKNVKSVRVVTGPYDLIVLAKAKDLSTLTNVVIEGIHRTDGVEDTNTAIIV